MEIYSFNYSFKCTHSHRNMSVWMFLNNIRNTIERNLKNGIKEGKIAMLNNDNFGSLRI